MEKEFNRSRRCASLLLLLALAMAVLIAVADAMGDGRTADAADGWYSVSPISVELTTVEIAAENYEYDPQRDVIYAAVGSTISPYENSVVIITPDGDIKTPLPVPNGPGKMTISDGEQFLYVSSWHYGQIYKIDIDAWRVIDVWSLPAGGDQQQSIDFYDLHPVPGDPDAVIVSREGLQPGVLYETAVYDASGMRPNTLPLTSPMYLTSGASEFLYGSTGHKLYVIGVDASGITTPAVHNIPLHVPPVYNDGLLFDGQGAVLSTETYQFWGRFQTEGLVVPDVAAGLVYFLHSPTVFALPWLEVFDLATFRKSAAGALPMNPNYPWMPEYNSFFAAGDGLYAFSYSRGLHLMRFAVLDHSVGIPVVARAFCADVVDDFSTNVYDWPTGDTPEAQFSLTSTGQYAILSHVNGPILVESPLCRRRGYEVSVEARWVGQPGDYYGLRYLIDHPMRQPYGDALLVSTTRGAWARGIPDETNPGNAELFLWTKSDAIYPGNKVNQLRVVFDGQRAIGYINGIQVFDDPQFPSGPTPHTGVGLLMRPANHTTMAEAWFDNFTYRKEKVFE